MKQEIASKTEEEIDKTRGGYKPVSSISNRNLHGTSLFFYHGFLLIFFCFCRLTRMEHCIVNVQTDYFQWFRAGTNSYSVLSAYCRT